MNIYSPYLALVDTPERLELQLGRDRNRFFFIYFRAVPVAFLAFAVLMRQVVASSSLPQGFLVLPVLLVLVGVVLRSNRYITGIVLDKSGAAITAKRLLVGEGTRHIPVGDIKSLATHVQEGRGGSAFFLLELKDGSRAKLLVIPQADLHKDAVEQLSASFAKRLKVPLKNK